MIRHHRKQRFFAEINITPFTDVILVLLIIFMVAAPVIYQSNIKVKLPKAKSAQNAQDKNEGSGKVKSATVTVTAEGMIYLGDELLTSRELKDKITVMHKESPDLSVNLRADQLTRFKDVVEVLDMLTALGVAKLDIATIRSR